jgi:glycosyltransferase involved in cell wall biosynthesis
MPRVLLTGFCAVPGPRRAGVQLRHVIRALSPLHALDLLVVREGDQPYVERQGGVRVLRVPPQEAELRLQIQAFQRALKRQLDGADYDVVHCRDSWSAMPVLEARARLGYAVVYDLSRSPLGETTYDPELDAQYARDEEACLAAADLVLAPTPEAVAALRGRGAPDRVVLSPLGVDVDRFDWELPAGGSVPRVLYVGTIDPGRGVRVLIRAMAAVIREAPARLVLAGPMVPRFEPTLRDAIRELGLVSHVEIMGPVDHDQLPALLATAAVCVVPAAADLTPSPSVVYPTKLLEYMACRTAIVAPRRETLAHVVEHGREALLFEPGDPLDLARKVVRLLAEPALRDRLAHSAYERVRREQTASAARRALRTAYAQLIARLAISSLDTAAEDVPRIEQLADDDFEATVFEEAPSSPQVDTAVSKVLPLADALQALGDAEPTGTTSKESQRSPLAGPAVQRAPSSAPPDPGDPGDPDEISFEVPDETMERAPVAAAPPGDRAWTISGLIDPPEPRADDWTMTDGPEDIRIIEVDEVELLVEEGTPSEGVIAASAPVAIVESSFVAGEIDVPTPAPTRQTPGSGTLFAPREPAEPDTGTRIPPIDRR